MLRQGSPDVNKLIEITLDTINFDTLLKILYNLRPRDILKLCQTNKHFRNICRDDKVFIELMKVHFPHIPINQKTKQQYISLTEKQRTTYSIIIDHTTNIVTDTYNHKIDLYIRFDKFINTEINKRITQGYFNINGEKLDVGTKLWLSINYAGMTIETIKAYKTKRQAIDEFVKTYYDYFLPTMKFEYYMSRDARNRNNIQIRDPGFIEFLNKHKYPTPFTKPILYEYCMNNNFFNSNPDNELHIRTDITQFVEVKVI